MNKTISQEVEKGVAAYVEKDGNLNIENINITSGVKSRDLLESARLFLIHVTRRDWKAAALQLESLSTIGGLDNECRKLLEILNVKLLMQRDNSKTFKRDVFLELLRSSQVGSELKDIIESVYIHFICLSSPESAKERYLKSSEKLIFCQAVYLELLAGSEELGEVKKIELLDSTEVELCSYVRFALRLNDFEFAKSTASILDELYGNLNSKVLLLLAKAYSLHQEIHQTHFWLLESSCYENLSVLIKQCVELYRDIDDVRITHAASILLASTWMQSADLLNICLENIDEVVKVVPGIKNKLLSISSNNNQEQNAVCGTLNRSSNRLSKDEFSSLLFSLINGSVTIHSIVSWAKLGYVELSNKGEIVDDLLRIVFNSFRAENLASVEGQELEEQIKDFISNHQENLESINAVFLHILCIRLIELRLPVYIIYLVKHLLPESPWASPLVEDYAHALLEADQYVELRLLLNSIEDITCSQRLLSIQLQKKLKFGGYLKALDLIRKAIFDYDYKSDCYLWYQYLLIANLNDLSRVEKNNIISIIPKDILREHSEDGLRLVALISHTDAAKAAEFFLGWFIDNPEKVAKDYTDFWFSEVFRKNEEAYLGIKDERCSSAFVYKKNGTEHIKLLINRDGVSPYFLYDGSDLAVALKKGKPGEGFELGFDVYEIIESLSPFVAALRLSIKLRSDMNVGKDCFYQFNIKDNDVESVFRVLDRVDSQRNLVDPVIDGRAVPLLLKLKKTHEHDLVRGSFVYLEDKDSNEVLELFSKGQDAPSSVVIDVLSFVYLCITGFSVGVIKKGITPCISQETYQAISLSLKQLTDPSYLSLAKSKHGYVKTTASDIQKMSSVSNMTALLEVCEIVTPQPLDMPLELVRLKEFFEDSHYSSIKISLSKEIPFLCLDHIFCSVYEIFEVPLVNVNSFVCYLRKELSKASYEHIVRHVLTKLPVPISYQEIIDLCGVSDAQYWVAQILLAYPERYKSPEFALQVLTDCYVCTVKSIQLQVVRDKNSAGYRYALYILNACCRIAMQALEGDTCEKRVALLIHSVYLRIHPFEQLLDVTSVFFHNFIAGHFLEFEAIEDEMTKLLGRRPPC